MYRGNDKERVNFNYDNEEDEYRNAANENIPYESGSLWDNQFYKGRDQQNKPERVIDLSDEVTMEQETDNEGYSSDRLWDNIRQGDGLINETDEEINPNQDYDSDSLWSRDIYQGRNKNE